VAAGELALWKANQVAEAAEQWHNLEADSLIQLKRALRIYCAERDGCERLAARCGITKSTLSRWLNLPDARLSLAAMLDLCAAEGFSLAKLLVADLTRTKWPDAVSPSRVKRKLARLDWRRIETALGEAIDKGKQISAVAFEERVDRRSLRKIGALYEKLRDQNASERLSKRALKIKAAVADAEAVLFKLMQARRVPSVRNARLQTGQVWAVSQPRCIALLCLRTKLGDFGVSVPSRSIALNPQFQEEVTRAAERLRGQLLNCETVQSSTGIAASLETVQSDAAVATQSLVRAGTAGCRGQA
jgi:transcriptional regulator with XRE-family HTH domain